MPVASELLVRVAADTKDAEAGLSRVDKQVSSFARGAGALGGVAAAAFAGIGVAAIGLGAGLGGAVKTAADFEHAIAGVGALAGANADQIRQLSESALALGQDTSLSGIGARDAAAAMQELAAAGFTVGEMTGGVTKGVLLLASATGSSVAQAAEIAGDAFGAFRKSMGLTAADMPGIANLFVGAANVSSISLGDIGASMKTIGPVAASMGISIEEVTAAIAALGNQGIKGGEAGTALRGILASLADPSKESAKLIKSLGLNFRDAAGNMKDFGGISEELRTKMAGLTAAEREHAIVQLFGRENLAAILALMSEGEQGLAEYTKKIQEQGNAAAAGAARNNNLAGSWQALQGVGETAAIKIGQLLTPSLKEVVDWMTRGAQAALPLIDAWGPRLIAGIRSGIGQAVAIVSSFATAALATVNALRTGDFSNLFGPLITAISTAFGSDTAGKVTIFVSNLVTNLNLARDAVLTARQAFAGDWVSSEAIATPVRVIGELFLQLGNAVRTVQGWIAQIPAPVLAAAGAFLALGPALSIVGAILPTLIGALTGLGPIISILTSSLPLLGTVIGALGFPITALIVAVGLLAAAWATDFMGIQTATMPVIAAIQSAITTQLLPALLQVGPYLSTVVAPAFVQGWAQMQAATEGGVAAMQPPIERLIGYLRDDLGPAMTEMGATVGPAFSQMAQAVADAFETARPGLERFIAGAQQLGAAVAPIMEMVGAAILDALGPAMVALAEWGSVVIPQFAAAFEAGMGRLAPIVEAAARGIGVVLSAIAGFVESHAGEITTILTNAWTIISETIGTAMTVISSVISAGLQAIAGDWSGALATLTSGADDAWQHIGNIVTAAMSLIITIVGSGLLSLVAVAQATWSAFIAAVSSAMAQAVAAVQSGIAQILGALQSLAGQAGAAAAGIGAAIVSGLVGGIMAGASSVASAAAGLVRGALDAARGALDSHSPSREFIAIGHDAIDGLIVGIGEKEGEARKKAAEVASAVAKAVQDTLAAFTALSAFRGGPNGAQVSGFLASLADFMERFTTVFGGWEEDVLKVASGFASAASSAVGVIKGAVEGLQILDTFAAPLQSRVSAFLGALADFMEKFSTTAGGFEDDVLATSTAFAEGVGKAVGVLSGAVDGLGKLAAFRAPLESSVSAFLAGLADFMERFGTVAGGFEADVLAVSAAFAEGVGKAVGVLGNAVAGLEALGVFRAPLQAAVSYFLASLADFMERLSTVAGGFEDDVLGVSREFADGVGKAVGVLSGAIGGLMALADFRAPLQSSVSAFLASLADFMERFSTAAGGFEADVLAVSTTFAEGVGKAVGVLGSGVAALEGLAGFRAPMGSSVSAFLASLADFMERFTTATGDFEADVLAQAANFATGAGKVVAIIGGAVDGLSKLADFVAPSQTAIDNFVYAVYETVRKIAEMAGQMSAEGIETAGAFGTAAGSVFAALKNALDVFTGLAKLVVPSAQAIDNFGIAVAYTVRRLGEMADQIGKDGLKAAGDFGAKVGAIFGALKSAMDILASLEKFPATAKKALDAFFLGVEYSVERMKAAAGAAGDFATAAEDYRSQINIGVAAIRQAQAALQTVNPGGLSLPDLKGAGRSAGDAITEGARDALESHSPSQVMAGIGRDVVAGLVQGMDDARQDAAQKAAQVASAVADAVLSGVAAFKALGSFVAPGPGQIAAFGQTVREAVNDLAVLGEQLGQDIAASAAKFAEGAGKAVALYGSGVSAFAGLRTYVRPAAAAIYDFGEDLRLALNDLALLAEQVTTDASDLAGKFGEGAAKAVAAIANGVQGFVALKDYAQVPAAALYQFDRDLRAFINDFALVAEQVTIEASDLAGKFADGVGKAVGVLAEGVAGLSALRDFRAPTDAAIDAFASSVGRLMAGIARATGGLTGDGLTLAGQFADAAGKVLGIIGSGVTGLRDMITFVAPAQSAMDAFAAAVRDMMATLGRVAATLATEGVAASATFAEAVGKVFAGLNAGTSFFKSLDNLLLPDQAGIDRILAPMLAVVRTLGDAARQFDPGLLATTGALADVIAQVMAALQGGNQALAPVATGGGGGGGGQNIYYLNFYGDTFGFDAFDDRVVAAIEEAERRGRI